MTEEDRHKTKRTDQRAKALAQHAADPSAHEDELAKLPQDAADALRQLRRHEDDVARALRDPANAERFYRDPIGTLRALGIDVPQPLARYASKLRQPPPQPMSFRLPTGQAVRPRVNVRFTGRARR